MKEQDWGLNAGCAISDVGYGEGISDEGVLYINDGWLDVDIVGP